MNNPLLDVLSVYNNNTVSLDVGLSSWWRGHVSVAIGNPEQHVHKASHCGSKQQWSSHAMITPLLLVHATYMYGVVLHAHAVRGESHI